MFDKELIQIWQNASLAEQLKFKKSKLLLQLDNKLGEFDNKIRLRDRREIIVAILIIPFFVVAGILLDNLYTRIGAGIIVGYCMLIIYKLRHVKKYKKPTDLTVNFKEQLLHIREYISKERDLLDSVIYWYLFPVGIGILFFSIGVSENNITTLVYLIVVLIVFAGIYFINKKAVKTNFNPLIEKLNRAIIDLENEV